MASTAQVFRLQKPVVVRNTDGEEINRVEQLTIRTEVVSGDLRGIPMRSPPWADDLLKMISRLSGQPDNVVNRLSIQDFNVVAEAVLGFMEGSPDGAQDVEPGNAGTTASPQ